MNNDVCILISTCDRYRPVAEWTAHRIGKSWKSHPPLRYAGLGDSRDWMTVSLAGVEAARREGYRWIYLILDDHPPVGLCNDAVLNNELPRLAAQLQAVNIGLLGWGQRRECEGRTAEDACAKLLRCDVSFRWKFSLHPSLWHADSLRELLEARMTQFSGLARTPWNFERHRDRPDGPVRREFLERCYLVHGVSMSACLGLGTEILRQPALLAFDLWRFMIRIVRGKKARDAFDAENLWLYHYYRGPYPIFWSGAMRQGVPSREFEKFLRFTPNSQMRREWNKVKEELNRRC